MEPSHQTQRPVLQIGSPEMLSALTTRRSFMKILGLGGTIVLLPSVLAGCNDDDSDPVSPNGPVTLDLRTNSGVVNYAYALEQLEAAFYTQAVATSSNLTAAERTILTGIRDHEVAHRETLGRLLGAARLPNLSVNFGSVNFADRTSVLQTAKTFEDLGVSAYNGAGALLTDAGTLLLAGKIVSVEARHAAIIRDILNPGSVDFAGPDVVDAQGLDVSRSPSEVLAAARPFVSTQINLTT